MNKTAFLLPLLLAAGSAQGQDAAACPQLDASTGLTWEYRGGNGADFCRALRADGSEAFGMYISRNPTFSPNRINRSNRKESDTMGGREVQWYRAELAGQPDVQARETLVKLDDGRSAHVWLQAESTGELEDAFKVTRRIDFSSRHTTKAVAGQ